MAGKKGAGNMEVVHPDCAGIDIGKRRHYVAVDGARFEEPVRNFGTFTAGLEGMAAWLTSCGVREVGMAAWLTSCGVREVAMESTGVYWIPVFEVLDRAGFEVHLVNARATKQVSGRKSDVMDCQWIRQLMSHGLLRGAYRVPDEVCALRAYLRQRDELVGQRSRAVHHMQKALAQMNVQLDNVLSDLMGKTGQLIVRAVVAGERDGAVLAGFRDGRCKADEATRAASLRGNWRDEHLFALEQALARYDALQGQIAACEERINGELDKLARPDAGDPSEDKRSRKGRDRALRRRLKRMLGVDLLAIPTIGVETALTVAAEVGADLSRFPSVGHFCSWLALAPGTRISGDRRLKGRLARMDTAKAVKATAHELARLIYAMLTRGEEYVERDLAAWEEECRGRMVANLQRQARRFDLALVSASAA